MLGRFPFDLTKLPEYLKLAERLEEEGELEKAKHIYEAYLEEAIRLRHEAHERMARKYLTDFRHRASAPEI
ncbi:MAG: hypothetical protein HY652_02480 [Acidobacteria bacterium]|nr:hypothetical protein [Acidobacteriota bacterium]